RQGRPRARGLQGVGGPAEIEQAVAQIRVAEAVGEPALPWPLAERDRLVLLEKTAGLAERPADLAPAAGGGAEQQTGAGAGALEAQKAAREGSPDVAADPYRQGYLGLGRVGQADHVERQAGMHHLAHGLGPLLPGREEERLDRSAGRPRPDAD